MINRRYVIIGGLILTITFLHYSCQLYILGHTQFHNLFIRLFYFPILLSAFWFGFRGGLSSGLLCAFLYSIDLIRWWNPENPYHYNKVFEPFLMIGIGLALGLLVTLERKSKNAKKLAEAKAQGERKKAITDPLTGVYNRRYMEEKIQESWVEAKSGNSLFSLMMVDLNKFKLINDTFGHSAGDRVLKATSETILTHCRNTDFTFRFGGDEFLILLPNTQKAEALDLAKRIRAEMAKITFQVKDQEKFKSDFSIGVMEFDPMYQDFHDMFLKLELPSPLKRDKKSGP